MNWTKIINFYFFRVDKYVYALHYPAVRNAFRGHKLVAKRFFSVIGQNLGACELNTFVISKFASIK